MTLQGKMIAAFAVVGLAGALTAVAHSPAAWAQGAETGALFDRIDRLERDIRTLSQTVYRGAAPQGEQLAQASGADTALTAGPAAARINMRLDDIEGQLRALTGSIEGLSHGINTVNQRLDMIISDLEFRLGSLEKSRVEGGGQATVRAAPAPGGVQAQALGARAPGVLGTIEKDQVEQLSPPPAAASAAAAPEPQAAPAAPLPAGTPEEQYNHARNFLITQSYDEGERALRAFLDRHGNHALASNARYWLGETYYVRGQFDQAAATFLDAYKVDEKGGKAPDLLLKLGMSLDRLGKTPEACATFHKMLADFPNADARLRNMAQSERTRLKCS